MSFEMDITGIKKLLKEAWDNEHNKKAGVETPVITPETPTKPATEPDTEPDTKPTKTPAPWEPTPGISPKPKALVVAESFVMTNDVALFFQNRNEQMPEELKSLYGPNKVVEAEGDPAEPEDEFAEEHNDPAVHPTKMDWIQAGATEKIRQLLPGSTEQQVEYLCTVSSEGYDNLCKRIREYTGIPFTRTNVPQLYSLLMETLEKTIRWESKNKERLEELAVELVFSVPEYKMAEESYLKDRLRIDAKIDVPDLRRLLQPQEEVEVPEETGLTPEETMNQDLANSLKDIYSAQDLRRKFANFLITGGTINKLYLYNLIADKLNHINPKLVNCYGIISAVVQLLYWVTPMGTDQMRAGNSSGEDAAGSEEVIPEGDIYVVKARGRTFPFLVHELSKGLSEWILLSDDLKDTYKNDTLEDETEDMLIGPGIHKTVMSYIPADKQEIVPLVQKKLVAMGPAEMQDVIGNTPKGKQIMAGLVQAAEREWNQYKDEKESDGDSFGIEQ